MVRLPPGFKVAITVAILSVTVTLSSALTCANAMAAEGGKVSVGLLQGLAFPSSNSAAICLAGAGSYRVWGPIGVGPIYMKYGVTADIATALGQASVTTSTTLYGAEGAVFLGGSFLHSHAGLRLGLAHLNRTATATSGTNIVDLDDSSTYLFVAPKFAYDHPLGQFSVGGEVSYIFGLGTKSPKAFTLLLPVKFWF